MQNSLVQQLREQVRITTRRDSKNRQILQQRVDEIETMLQWLTANSPRQQYQDSLALASPYAKWKTVPEQSCPSANRRIGGVDDDEFSTDNHHRESNLRNDLEGSGGCYCPLYRLHPKDDERSSRRVHFADAHVNSCSQNSSSILNVGGDDMECATPIERTSKWILSLTSTLFRSK
ncbi:hypothetical protein QAD02_019040 [Eretmocerus hayati]|uniref:Uncharacterized protein n=1 Tax=Eretmocerus hayati TaxID=131215 RepID=A0ACC2PJM7_9HYME|nr:hypothetical protein QAD02_019040 [Eretmocerus hayati]